MDRASKFSKILRGLCASAMVLTGIALTATQASAQSVADIKSKGKVVIGIQGDNSPWGFINSTGVQDGFDADMGKLFAKELGVEVQFVPTAVANRIPALVTGKVDILFATMGMFPDRAKSIQFSKPYAANKIQLVAPKKAEIKTPADMKNFIIGAARGSSNDTSATQAAPQGTEIRRFDDDAATIQAMLSGQVTAVAGNQFYPGRLNAATPDTYEAKLDFLTQYNGAGTRLGEKEWNAYVNSFIDKIKANGELDKIYQKWIKLPLPEFPASMEGVSYTVQ